MCLRISDNYHSTTRKPIPKKALKDIEVFKLLKRAVRDGKKVWITPFQKFQYETGYVYYNRGKDPFTLKHPWYDGAEWNVEQGLHAYRTLEKAIQTKKYESNRQIFRAVIPKGSLYFMGTNDDIVSNQLQILELAKDGKRKQTEVHF